MLTSSNIRVFVTFKDSAIFAGEEVEAVVTFKNVETSRLQLSRSPLRLQPSHHGSTPHSRATSKAVSSRPPLSRSPSGATLPSQRPPVLGKTRHRPTASLNIVDSVAPNTFPPRSSKSAGAGIHIAEPGPRDERHNRSVSIISIGSDTNSVDRRQWSASVQSPRSSRPSYKHARSASLQVSPVSGLVPSSSLNGRQPNPSPLSAASPRFRSAESYFSQRDSLRNQDSIPASTGGGLQQNFQFPPGPKTVSHSRHGPSSSNTSPASPSITRRPATPTRDGAKPARPPPQRVLSLASAEDTPRTSADLYSMSNLSDETLASEYFAQLPGRLAPASTPGRKPPSKHHTPDSPEELMMGYVQLTGTFLLDGSLVDQTLFEEVKRKAVIGGQGGGGVVGLERSKADSGFFGSLGWTNFGESLGGFLRSNEQSSIREMKDAATSKNVPIISTPKSILFVGLKLNPGESRSFSYSIKLPRTLPPSHKGRAMKVSYQLVVGMQRPSTTRTQDIRTTEVPFRIFNSVSPDGDMPIHNLLAPIIILRDEAKTVPLDSRIASTRMGTTRRAPETPVVASDLGFMSYVHHLLGEKDQMEGSTLLSPTADSNSVPPSPSGDHAVSLSNGAIPSVRTTIDHAIRFASSSASGEPTAFNIARASRPIATLFISRPALRLGDSLHLLLSFADAHIPCYALDVTLESIESVDQAISMRSSSSVERVTRRVWDRITEPGFSLGWCGRWSGRLKVPWNATPAFITSGVSCRWAVRVEVVIGVEAGPRQVPTEVLPEEDEEEDPEGEEDTLSDTASLSTSQSERNAVAIPGNRLPLTRALSSGRRSASSSKPRRSKQFARPRLNRAKLLLEDVGADERGRHLAPRQRVFCESFDISVPVRVFGAPGGSYPETTAALGGLVI